MVSRASTIWRASLQHDSPSWEYVIKDQWRDAKRGPEGVFLASARGCSGVVQHIWHGDTEHVVSGLRVSLSGGTPVPIDDPSESASTSSSRKRKSTTQSGGKAKLQKSTGSLATPTDLEAVPWGGTNRIHARLMMTPVGREIQNFKSYTELLEAFRDSIRSHRCLYQQRNILHRDISLYNILLSTDPTSPVRGFIVDLDLAISVNRITASGATHRTGTYHFMAIGILLKDKVLHSFRHDLESFFYVLVYLCIFYCGPGGVPRAKVPEDNLFSGQESPYRKYFMMSRALFEPQVMQTLQHEMRMKLGPLVVRWRDALFGSGDVFFGTPEDEDRLYDDMLTAVEDRIAELASSGE